MVQNPSGTVFRTSAQELTGVLGVRFVIARLGRNDVVRWLLRDGGYNQGCGDLQPGSRPEPDIIVFWGSKRPDGLPAPLKKVGGRP